VTARTYSIPDYALLFDDLDSFYIDQQGLLAGSTETMLLLEGGSALSQGLKVKSEEKEMLLSILSQMIRYNLLTPLTEVGTHCTLPCITVMQGAARGQ